MKSARSIGLGLTLIALWCAAAPAATFDWTTVGDAGNLDDTTGFGGVDSDFQISTYEVTNAHYAEFLNAVAADDTYNLYHPDMASGVGDTGGITRGGSPGSYVYTVRAGRGNQPVNYVDFYDTLRFCNWLHNGQLAGAQDATTTEFGAYNMGLGGAVYRHSWAQFWLPNEDEWYKAAYYQGGSTTAAYFDYPTSSDTAPTATTPPGSGNAANFLSAVGGLTDVGSYVGSASPYGTYDQGGNLWEWTETAVGPQRIVRGGSWSSVGNSRLSAGFSTVGNVDYEYDYVGFRIARPVPVPEPASAIGVALAVALFRRR